MVRVRMARNAFYRRALLTCLFTGVRNKYLRRPDGSPDVHHCGGRHASIFERGT